MKCRILKGGNCEITQWYNEEHGGCDLVGGAYTLDYITAHSNGVVVSCRNNCNKSYTSANAAIAEWGDSYGNYVLLKHSDNIYTMYAHMGYNTLQVSKGQAVKKGQVLGYMGATGNATGGHLHFEYRTNENWYSRTNCMDFIDGELPIATLPNPVEENHDIDQLKVNYANTMRVRTNHKLNASIIGMAKVGFYNILDSANGEGYTWVMVEKDKWISVIPPNNEIKHYEPLKEEIKSDSEVVEETDDGVIVKPLPEAVIKDDGRSNMIVELINLIIKILKGLFNKNG